MSPEVAVLLAVVRAAGLVGAVETQDLHCLALNAYFDAADDGPLPERAVSHVVLNRVDDQRWPGSVCEVVFERTFSSDEGRMVGQFDWTTDDEPNAVPAADLGQPAPPFESPWATAVISALRAMLEDDDPTSGATHYYDPGDFVPVWTASPRIEDRGRFGKHVFLYERR